MQATSEDYEEFKCEAIELIDVAEKSLLALDSGADFKATFDAVFRCFHNLKGAAGLMEFNELQSHTHELETKLLQFKDTSTIPKEYVTLFLHGLDGARAILSGGSSEPKVTATSIVADAATDDFFVECDEIVQRVAEKLSKFETVAPEPNDIDALYREFHSLKGSAYLFGFSTLGDIAHLIESSLEPVRAGTHSSSNHLIDGIFGALKLIELEAQAAKLGQPNPKHQEILASLAKALKAHTPPPIVAAPVGPDAVSSAAIPAPAPFPTPVSTKDRDTESGSIRVSVGLLDSLMTLVGEMVLVRNQVLQFSNHIDNQEFLNLSKRLNTVTAEIQDGMMKTRMQPIGNVLNKFSRVARDLSHELGKRINVQLSGTETELDKSLLEAIKDPLTHIVRNSCDHGIETPSVRAQAGKTETGTITIRSFHEGGQVIIEVSDDGKGLNREALIKKAIEKGMVTEVQAQSLPEKNIFDFIFAPGFSTAKKVTNVSGRGVGMDVVRTNIEKIGGTVELQSITGKGTTTLIKIPLTLAIVPALIISNGGSSFAIPQLKLVELVRVDQANSATQLENLQGVPVYRLRGNLLPLVDLGRILEQPKGATTETPPSIVNIAVLNSERGCFGLIVEEILDTADIVVKPLSRALNTLSAYSGATVMGDGSVSLILDVTGLHNLALSHQDKAGAREQSHTTKSNQRPHSELQDYVLLKVNSPAKHAIVLGYVHRLEEFKKTDFEFLGTKKVVRYRNSLLHIVSANEHLGYGNAAETKAACGPEMVPIIVVERAGALFGIEVQDIIDTLSTEIDPDPGIVKQPGIFGTLNMPQELIVVIDPFELISADFGEIKPKAAPSAVTATDRPLRILLAEDTVFFKKAITLILSKAGHQVTPVNDGQEALEIFNQNGDQFDIVVSDIDMPRMNGLQLARSIRHGNTHSSIPMLAVSSRGAAAQMTEGLDAGFDIYMEKLKPELLLKTIAQLADQARKVA